jgi:predicted house-cleaning noncanonical NTP pyrophosphatase (MazG superfamily)
MRTYYNKLVRDRIPEIIAAEGRRATTHVLDLKDYRAALLAKLVEEAREAAAHASDAQLLSELADVVEVVRALVTAVGATCGGILELAADKRSSRGGFDKRIFLEYVK